MSRKTSLLILASLLLFTAIHAAEEGHKCTHDPSKHPEPELFEAEEGLPAEHSRNLADLPNLRMKAWYELPDTDPVYAAYIQNDLVPPVLDYFSAALKTKYPVATVLKWPTTTTSICGISTPPELWTGVATDYYYIVRVYTDNGASWVADSTTCFLSTGSKRPYMGRTTINSYQVLLATDDVLRHEKNVVLMMHELTHTLGFGAGLFQYFIDANGNPLTGHILSDVYSGYTTTVLNVEPLTTKLRQFFGCPTLKGAYMENTGGGATAGSHFERRIFGIEYMTSGWVYMMQVSPFTLALLEGSGWYSVDYSYADSYTFGQGQGCDFIMGDCDPADYDEFCSDSEQGCVTGGLGGGVCASDLRSDSCRFIHPRTSFSCEDPTSANNIRLPQLQSFGRETGAKCFTGNLTSATTPSFGLFCFKPSCAMNTTNTTVTVNTTTGGLFGGVKTTTTTTTTTQLTLTLQIGGKPVACIKKGPIAIAGYKGFIECPDPAQYCSMDGAPICPRGCMGRGTCVNGICQCRSGYVGKDCASYESD